MANDKEECFVVCAIGADGSQQRTHADWVLEGIIKPLFAEHYPQFKVHRADHMNVPGLIDAQIIDKLLNAKLVIADLTWLNPNAFYEIGIRHVVGKPIIHMNLATETIPFDTKMYLSLPFSVTKPHDLSTAQAGLKAMVDAVLDPEYVVDNPVTRARGQAQFAQTATPAEQLMQSEFIALRARLARIEGRLATSMRKEIRGLDYDPPPEVSRSELIFFQVDNQNEAEAERILEAFLIEIIEPIMVEGAVASWLSRDQFNYKYPAGGHSVAQLNMLKSKSAMRGIDMTVF